MRIGFDTAFHFVFSYFRAFVIAFGGSILWWHEGFHLVSMQ